MPAARMKRCDLVRRAILYQFSQAPLCPNRGNNDPSTGPRQWDYVSQRRMTRKKSSIMTIVYAPEDAEFSDRDRRLSLFAGNLFVYGPRPCTVALSEMSCSVIEEIFGQEPVWAQQRMSEEEFASRFERAATNLRHLAPELAGAAATDLGCDPNATYFKPPSLTTTTGHGFIAHGLGVPQHPHRDTWYSASMSQLNWWVPLYDIDAKPSLAFHPQYWDRAVKNTSKDFDFEEWREAVLAEPNLRADEPSAQPRSIDPIELTPDIRIACAPGGVVLSSAAQLCSTIPNETLQTHFAVKFQTVHEADLTSGAGADNLDASPRGTLLPSFVRCSDLSPIPMELVQREMAHRTER
jgi:hypothetical protein